MTRPYALLRAGFPYLKTIGMRRMTNFPVDLAVGDEGRLYMLLRGDSASEIKVWHFDDEDLGSIGGGELTWAVGIVRCRDGSLMVTDEALHRVSIFDEGGNLSARWGERGDAPGALDRPTGIALYDGDVLVADSLNHRIQRFTVDGRFLSGWGRRGSGPGELDLPWGIAVDEMGDVYVADWGNDRVQKFDRDGRYLMSFGESSNGNPRGALRRPSGVDVDADGDVYVADWGNNRVVQFDENGRYLDQFVGDATLSRVGLRYIRGNLKILRQREMTSLEPTKRLRRAPSVKIDDSGRLYIVDHGGHRIQIYRKEAYRLEPHEIMEEQRSPSLDTQ